MDRWLLIAVVKFDDEIPEGSDWLNFFGQSSFSKGHFLRAWDLTHFAILFEKWRENLISFPGKASVYYKKILKEINQNFWEKMRM